MIVLKALFNLFILIRTFLFNYLSKTTVILTVGYVTLKKRANTGIKSFSFLCGTQCILGQKVIIIIIIIIITFISMAQIQQFSFQMRFTILGEINVAQIIIYNHYSQIKSNQMLVFDERGRPEYPGENLS